jgi:predicted RNA-binding Zn-ribbon protein involved in translation (DUF1610 family)
MPAMHPSLTNARVTEAVERYHASTDNPGFCTSCGAEADSVEPDAEGYECECCGEHAVMGAEMLFLIHFG